MRISTNVVATMLASFMLFACGAGQAAKAPEADPWADYKGTYAGPVKAEAKQPAKADKADKTAKADPPADKTDDATPAATTTTTSASTAKKTSKGTIGGESVSSVRANALADASKSALKSKVVSSKTLVGAQYEQVDVKLKGGSGVTIIRPAGTPDPSGPAVAAPAARLGDLSPKTDSGWYDDDADVLVVVTAGKRATAQKALGVILKH